MNRITTIYAKDATPAAIAVAFAEQVRRCPAGLFGPINPPMIYIPRATLSPARARLPMTPTRSTAVKRTQALSLPVTLRPSADPQTALREIRAHRYAIAGYACLFNTISRRCAYVSGADRELVKPGAFARAIAGGGWHLLVDHRNYADDQAHSLASITSRTLHVEEDERGVWFEAALDGRDGARIFDRVCRREVCEVSIGSSGASGYITSGTYVLEESAGWEISLVTPPFRAARVGTFVLQNMSARRQRLRLAASQAQ